ncbi:MAG: hypothetical protein IJC14_01225 [Firmicutes bacterium]|nr:hypothetical protein [Bacillota bacterium]
MGRDYLFSNKKKSVLTNKLFYIVILAVFVLGVSMLIPEKDIDKDQANDNENIIVDSETVKDNDDERDFLSETDEDSRIDIVVSSEYESYYLLKESEGRIELLFFDESGSRLIKVTDIPFNLISTEDQNVFREGLKLENEEALDEILQDFES